MVYVISKDGQPLMPTKRHAKVRILLKQGLAKVKRAKPFTIQLTYETSYYTQPLTLGIDSGYTYIGYSVVSKKEEVVGGEVILRHDIKELLKEKLMYRRQRRQRLRYRAPRFDNRKRQEGWLAPSIQHKLDSHIRFIDKLKKLMPISNVVVEVANFDIQKIENPEIESKQYQEGEQKDFWNLREYILHRDNHSCQNPNCKNKAKEKILQVHHIGFYKGDRSDRPSNLITLCNKCHTPKNHEKGKLLWDWKPKVKTFKEAAFMSVVRWRLVNELDCQHTYGFKTKSKRIELGLEKSHHHDAFCIAGGTSQVRGETMNYQQVRRNNRSLEKFYDKKIYDIRTKEVVSGQQLFSGRRTRNKKLNSFNLRVYRGETKSKGRRTIRRQRYFYQPNDLVRWSGQVVSVKGVQNLGAYIKLKLEPKDKVVKISDVTPYRFSKGLVVGLN